MYAPACVETGPIRLYDSPGQVPVVAVMCIAAVLVARARRRLKAVVLLGVVGYGMPLGREEAQRRVEVIFAQERELRADHRGFEAPEQCAALAEAMRENERPGKLN